VTTEIFRYLTLLIQTTETSPLLVPPIENSACRRVGERVDAGGNGSLSLPLARGSRQWQGPENRQHARSGVLSQQGRLQQIPDTRWSERCPVNCGAASPYGHRKHLVYNQRTMFPVSDTIKEYRVVSDLISYLIDLILAFLRSP
jgi:hypothetical protein